jgi:hypothetical protein
VTIVTAALSFRGVPASLALLCRYLFSNQLVIISWTTITVWTISGLLAAGVGWSRYEKKKSRDKFLTELAAMNREARERLLTRLQPDVQNELRQQLMLRYGLF